MENNENADAVDIQVGSPGAGNAASAGDAVDANQVQPASSSDNGGDGSVQTPPAQPPAKKVKTFQVFKLANGYVTRAIFEEKKAPDAAAADKVPDGQAAEAAVAAETKKRSYAPAFWFQNRYFGNGILLYGNQALDLVDELPNAYQALAKADLEYRFVVAKSKENYVTLEVSHWNNKNRLQLKPHFKSNRPYKHPSSLSLGEVDENAWIPAHRSSVNFDPEKDKPEALLHFLLVEGQK